MKMKMTIKISTKQHIDIDEDKIPIKKMKNAFMSSCSFILEVLSQYSYYTGDSHITYYYTLYTSSMYHANDYSH